MYNFLENIPTEVYRAYFPDPPLPPEEGTRINAENPFWEKLSIPRLSEKCVRCLAKFFSVKPLGAVHLHGKDRALFLHLLSTTESIKLTVERIQDEIYWKRCCLSNLGITHCNVSEHGNSWKRLYCESYIQNLVERFVPTQSDINELKKSVCIFEPYTKRLHIEELLPRPLDRGVKSIEIFKSNEIAIGSLGTTIEDPETEKNDETDNWERFDFSTILPLLKEIQDFSVCYRVKKIGTDFRWELFRITMRDSSNLANGLRSLKKLHSLTIKNSNLDDEMMYEIYDGIRILHNLSVLNLPNNI
ncbi:dynein regulatory complex subunit 5-like [Lepeophtheirus salmonis]|uniref:dynein regulatory complex subunit 5-like n=1 Tax=Lepeophtheirus salmonis TaxID=72036 RepID=UPI001AE198E7|nr:dynein regulatory complex subunit 5-like [Lepeophtheirus salmonis]